MARMKLQAAKLQAARSDPDIHLVTLTQMREAAQRLRDELKEPTPASCTGLLYCCLLYNVK